MRVILLGIGGSGKTTFSKQMIIIHAGSFDEERAKSYKSILLANILLGLKAITAKTTDLVESENYKKSRWVQSLEDTEVNWDAELVEKIKALWADEGIQVSWKEVKDTVIIQMEYLMENIDRFIQPDCVPTNDDILRARQRSTGEATYRFEDPKTVWYLTDVGGQYSERKKWNEYFSSITPPHAIIFFLALDEYNVPNTEITSDSCATKLELAMQVFSEILVSTDGPVVSCKLCRIVFLNKYDVFTEKLKEQKKFQDFKQALKYEPEEADPEACAAFVASKLKQMVLKEEKKQQEEDIDMKVHVTNALDTKLMQRVAADIKVSIITSTLKDLGMIQ